MKCSKFSTDQSAEVQLFVNGSPAREYVLPQMSGFPNTVECFVAVAEGDVITIGGSFKGSCHVGAIDLVVDGSFLKDKRFSSGQGGGVKRQRAEIKFGKVYDQPTPEGFLGVAPSNHVVEGRLVAKVMEARPARNRSGDFGLGSVAVVICISDTNEESHKPWHRSTVVGAWRARDPTTMNDGGIGPTHEMGMTVTDRDVHKSSQARHRSHAEQSRFGSEPWATFVFHYRSLDAIRVAEAHERSNHIYVLNPDGMRRPSFTYASASLGSFSSSVRGRPTDENTRGDSYSSGMFITPPPPPPAPMLQPTASQQQKKYEREVKSRQKYDREQHGQQQYPGQQKHQGHKHHKGLQPYQQYQQSTPKQKLFGHSLPATTFPPNVSASSTRGAFAGPTTSSMYQHASYAPSSFGGPSMPIYGATFGSRMPRGQSTLFVERDDDDEEAFFSEEHVAGFGQSPFGSLGHASFQGPRPRTSTLPPFSQLRGTDDNEIKDEPTDDLFDVGLISNLRQTAAIGTTNPTFSPGAPTFSPVAPSFFPVAPSFNPPTKRSISATAPTHDDTPSSKKPRISDKQERLLAELEEKRRRNEAQKAELERHKKMREEEEARRQIREDEDNAELERLIGLADDEFEALEQATQQEKDAYEALTVAGGEDGIEEGMPVQEGEGIEAQAEVDVEGEAEPEVDVDVAGEDA